MNFLNFTWKPHEILRTFDFEVKSVLIYSHLRWSWQTWWWRISNLNTRSRENNRWSIHVFKHQLSFEIDWLYFKGYLNLRCLRLMIKERRTCNNCGRELTTWSNYWYDPINIEKGWQNGVKAFNVKRCRKVNSTSKIG